MKEHGGGEDREIEEELAEAASPPSNAIAEALVLGSSDHKQTPEVAAYLAAQTKLLGVQFEHMHQQRVLQLEHLSVRRMRERLQISLQLLLWLVAAIIIGAVIALAVWAMHDESMVIRPLKAPPALAAQGLDGTVLATKLLDGVKLLQSQASSARAPSTLKGSAEDDIKVEIPETGVSVGELLKYLRAWLGHETQVSGEVYFDGPDLVVTVRSGEEVGKSFRGPRETLDKLMAQASETVFAQTQPYLYAVYLNEHDRTEDSFKTARDLATSGPIKERGWAYAHWAHLLLNQGDDVGAAVRARQALAYNSALVTAENNLAAAEWNLSHDEAAFQARRRALDLIRPGRPANVTAAAADQFRTSFEESVDEATGDYRGATSLSRQQMELPDYANDVAEASVVIADDLAEDHDVAATRAALAKAGLNDDAAVLKFLAADKNWVLPYADLDIALGDWSGAVIDLQAAEAWLTANQPSTADYRKRRLEPDLARALAQAGRTAEADALIDSAPLDCMTCLLARGRIAALEGRSKAADGWFQKAVDLAPSLPKPYLAWGVARLMRGDSAGAADFARQAIRRGLHYADAYVLLAEASLRQGRLRLAQTQISIANRYAPDWGLLHLIWGEALLRDHRGDDGLAQLHQAETLGLSPRDQARLARDLQHP